MSTIVNKDESSSSRSVVLVGHSMGGAVAVHAAVRDKVPNLVGLVLIDVVEGRYDFLKYFWTFSAWIFLGYSPIGVHLQMQIYIKVLQWIACTAWKAFFKTGRNHSKALKKQLNGGKLGHFDSNLIWLSVLCQT